MSDCDYQQSNQSTCASTDGHGWRDLSLLPGLLLDQSSVPNPGSGFKRRPRWSLGLRSVSVMNANAKPSRIRTGTCQRCERDPVTLRAERHESMASSVRSTP